MRRGDVIIIAVAGEFGKPRPALIIQADMSLNEDTVTYLPITSDLDRLPVSRIPVMPSSENGLRKPSEIMIDRIDTSTLSRIGGIIGHIDRRTMKEVEVALMLHLGLA